MAPNQEVGAFKPFPEYYFPFRINMFQSFFAGKENAVVSAMGATSHVFIFFLRRKREAEAYTVRDFVTEPRLLFHL